LFVFFLTLSLSKGAVKSPKRARSKNITEK